MNDNIKNSISSGVRTAAPWVILTAGILLYIYGFMNEPNFSLSKVAIKIADVFVIGVLIGFVTNAARFLGVFKSDLQDIIYGKEFITKGKDVYSIWECVSKVLFKNKFPVIHKELLKTVNGYLPKDSVSYYNDYDIHTTIDWADKTNGIIKVVDTISFDLIAESEDKIEYPIKTWTRIINGKYYKNEIKVLKVNGIDTKPKFVSEKIETEGGKCTEQSITLKGKTKYEIKYIREREYSFNEDYYLGLRAKYIVHKLRVSLELPDDIEAIFTCRGTQNDFEDVISKPNRIEKKYRGIILPRQGYIFALKLIN